MDILFFGSLLQSKNLMFLFVLTLFFLFSVTSSPFLTARKCLRRSLQEDISSTMHTPYSSFLSNSCESNPEKRSRIKSNVLFPAESLPSPKPCRSISFTDGTITEDLLSERFNTMDRSLDADSTEEISFISQSSLSTQVSALQYLHNLSFEGCSLLLTQDSSLLNISQHVNYYYYYFFLSACLRFAQHPLSIILLLSL